MIRLLDSVQNNGGVFTQVTAALATTGQFPLLATGTTLSTFANRLFLSPTARTGLSLSDYYQVQPNVLPFILRISGVYTSANASGTIAPAMVQNTTAGVGATVFSLAASPAVSTTSQNFFIEVDAIWDSTSLAVNGNSWGNLGGAVVAVSSIVPIASVTTLGILNFSLAATLAHTSLSDSIYITEFSMNLL